MQEESSCEMQQRVCFASRAHKMQIGAWCASLTPQNLSRVEILIKRRRALSELLSHISGASLFLRRYCKRDLKTLRGDAPQSAF